MERLLSGNLGGVVHPESRTYRKELAQEAGTTVARVDAESNSNMTQNIVFHLIVTKIFPKLRKFNLSKENIAVLFFLSSCRPDFIDQTSNPLDT